MFEAPVPNAAVGQPAPAAHQGIKDMSIRNHRGLTAEVQLRDDRYPQPHIKAHGLSLHYYDSVLTFVAAP